MTTVDITSRRGDPVTSRETGHKAARHAPTVRATVLEIMGESSPLTHDELISTYHTRIMTDSTTPLASESGIRTRLSELAHAGLVEADETMGVSTFGNRARRWRITDLGRSVL